MSQITSPAEGFTGRSYVGSHFLDFKDGVADYDGELPDGVVSYLRGAGFTVDGQSQAPAQSIDGRPVADEDAIDARDYAEPTQVGTQLRDAAVDPHPEDFLAPANAGAADPHGPEVVSPGIHANEGVRPVKPGDVHVDDIDTQDQLETEHAQDATDGTPVDDGLEVPAGNASTDTWRTYALAQGASETDVEGKSRDELRDAYAPKEA